MSALGPLLLSLGRFLRSHWAGFSQGKTGLVGSRSLLRSGSSLAPLLPALGPSPLPWQTLHISQDCVTDISFEQLKRLLKSVRT